MKTKVFFSGNDIIDFCLAIIYLVFWSSAWFMGFTNVQLRSDYGLFLSLLINAYQGAALFNESRGTQR